MVKSNKPSKNSIFYDAIILLIVFVLCYIVLNYFSPLKFNYINLGNESILQTFIGILGTLLGFLITAITIIFMFNNKENPLLILIQKAGLYQQIFERFITTILTTFIALIVTIGYLLFCKYLFCSIYLELIIYYLLALVLLRVYRVLKILYLIYTTFKNKPII